MGRAITLSPLTPGATVRAPERLALQSGRPREVRWIAYTAVDAAALRLILEPEADSPRNGNESKIHERVTRCIYLQREEGPPHRVSTFTSCEGCLVRPGYVIRRKSPVRAVLKSYRATRSRTSGAVVDMRLEDQLLTHNQCSYRLEAVVQKGQVVAAGYRLSAEVDLLSRAS